MGLDMRTYEFAWRPDGIPYMRKQPDEYPGSTCAGNMN